MPRNRCRTLGVLPGDQGYCDAWSNELWACTSEKGCEYQIEQLSEIELKEHEKVEIPSDLQVVAHEMKVRPELFSLLSEDVYEPVKEALKIIEKMSPLGKGGWTQEMVRYWDDYKWIDLDMGMLSSLYSQLAVLSSRMEANYKKAEKSVKIIKAEKFTIIKKVFASGIRPRKVGEKLPSDMAVKNLVTADQQVKDAIDIEMGAFEASRMFTTFAESVQDHINVLKRRLESIRGERRNAGNEGS